MKKFFFALHVFLFCVFICTNAFAQDKRIPEAVFYSNGGEIIRIYGRGDFTYSNTKLPEKKLNLVNVTKVNAYEGIMHFKFDDSPTVYNFKFPITDAKPTYLQRINPDGSTTMFNAPVNGQD